MKKILIVVAAVLASSLLVVGCMKTPSLDKLVPGGIGGLIDVADWQFGIPGHSEDFGQTLAVWGVDEGPYIVLPLLMVGVFFYYTARDMAEIEDVSQEPDVTVQVIGKQWSFDFNYLDDDVYEAGVHAEDIGLGGAEETLPTLYLPVGERVEIILDSRDVIHSFWVPAFLYKKDMIPWYTNKFQIVPEREGVYAGKCAELCGAWHSAMLFNVAVVDRETYDAQMQALRDKGQTGALELELSREQHFHDAPRSEN